jgi:hypothetical protein
MESSAESNATGAPPELKQNLADFLLESPLRDSGLKLERLKDYPRPIDL